VAVEAEQAKRRKDEQAALAGPCMTYLIVRRRRTGLWISKRSCRGLHVVGRVQ
jgi:hypothetical protein